MPRHLAFAVYSAIFIIALLAGLLIASVLRPRSLLTANSATPVVAPSLALSANLPTLPPSQTPTSVPDATDDPPATAATTATPEVAVSAPVVVSVVFLTPTMTPTLVAEAPPTQDQQPLVFAARLFDKPTDAAVRCGTAFESRVWGVVKNSSGRGIFRAVVQVTSTDGRNRYSRATNSQGGFEIPGLGCTTWVVRLASVPGTNGLQAQTMRVALNGGRYSGAGIEFRQQ